MKKSVVLVLLLMLPSAGSEASEPKPYEMPRTQVLPIKDSKTNRQYELYVKLPEGYSQNTDVEHPVIYTTDAVWHFEIMSGAVDHLMPNAILVGISWQKDLTDGAAHTSRFRDYSVVQSENPEIQEKYQLGQAADHLTFIRHDVIRFVERHFRVHPSERAYFGYSLGAVFGAYTLFAQPDTFKHYVLGSPALDQRDLASLTDLSAQTAPQHQGLNTSVFVSIGELEKSELGTTQDFVSLIQRKKQSGLSLAGLVIIEDADHGTAFPPTVIRGIKWLSRLAS